MDREVVDDRVIKHALARAGGVWRLLHVVHAHDEVSDVDALVDGALDALRWMVKGTPTRGSCQPYSQLSSGPLDMSSKYYGEGNGKRAPCKSSHSGRLRGCSG